jgi:hypothetical protein
VRKKIGKPEAQTLTTYIAEQIKDEFKANKGYYCQ